MKDDNDDQVTRKAVSEIASILADGYLRYRKSRRLEPEPTGPEGDMSGGENCPALTENGLDCLANRSNHSEPS